MRVQGLRFGNKQGSLDAFVAAAATGQTVAGFPGFSKSISFPSINLNIHIKLVNESLSECVQQEKNPNIKCFFIDPPDSGSFKKVRGGDAH